MKRTKTALLCTGLGLLISTALGGPTQSAPAANVPATAPAPVSSRDRIYQQIILDQQKRNVDLTAQCQKLAEENVRLEQQLKQIKQAVYENAQNSMPKESVPKNWRQEEINGMTFYIVPLVNFSNAGQSPARQESASAPPTPVLRYSEEPDRSSKQVPVPGF